MLDVKTVGLDQEAYERLRAEKRQGESFSDVVKRLTRKRRPLTDFAGLWKDLPPEDVRAFDEAFEAVRKAGRDQANRAIERMEELRARG
ncbi:MAG TPA: antitoxin VapB family protein [Candidatus Thermoplasmatota archaeon]